MATYFISYSRIDGLDFASWLSDSLVGGASQFDIWLDKDKLRAGQHWQLEIERALRSADAVLYVMTGDSVSPRSISREEIRTARSQHVPIIPLLIDKNVSIPFELQDLQHIDFTNDPDRALAILRSSLGHLSSEAPSAPARPAFKRPPFGDEPEAPRLELADKRVFISYSHRDRKWVDRLRIHFKPFERDGLLTVWEDTQIRGLRLVTLPGVRG